MRRTDESIMQLPRRFRYLGRVGWRWALAMTGTVPVLWSPTISPMSVSSRLVLVALVLLPLYTLLVTGARRVTGVVTATLLVVWSWIAAGTVVHLYDVTWPLTETDVLLISGPLSALFLAGAMLDRFVAGRTGARDRDRDREAHSARRAAGGRLGRIWAAALIVVLGAVSCGWLPLGLGIEETPVAVDATALLALPAPGLRVVSDSSVDGGWRDVGGTHVVWQADVVLAATDNATPAVLLNRVGRHLRARGFASADDHHRTPGLVNPRHTQVRTEATADSTVTVQVTYSAYDFRP